MMFSQSPAGQRFRVARRVWSLLNLHISSHQVHLSCISQLCLASPTNYPTNFTDHPNHHSTWVKTFFVDEMYEMSASVFEKNQGKNGPRHRWGIVVREDGQAAAETAIGIPRSLGVLRLSPFFNLHCRIAYLVEQKKCFPPHVYIGIDSKTSLTCTNLKRILQSSHEKWAMLLAILAWWL